MNRDQTDQRITGQDKSLRALAFELKHPLANIARQAELGDPSLMADMQQTAEQALQLIDSYILHAQTEYGQVALDLSPTSVGSVLYDVSNQLRPQAARSNTEFILDDRTHELAMTHRQALTSILTVFGTTIMGLASEQELKTPQKIILRGFRTRAGKIGIGMFGNAKLNQDDLRRALALQGRAHMPLAQASSTVHISLAIADGLCRAIGGSMQVKHMGRLSGLATELPPSEQLAFV
jgi:hypothetical protein